jgi:transposase InsO family protein
MERMAIDILGPLPETENGNRYILVLGEYFSKWMEAYSLADHTAQTVADTIISQFFTRFGVPQFLHTDQAPEYESHLFQQICKLLGVEKTRTQPSQMGLRSIVIGPCYRCSLHL